jgi:hypothetical protein
MDNTISSGMTGFYKKFPIVWFAVLAMMVVMNFADDGWDIKISHILGPVILASFGFFMMRLMYWDLMDEVCDRGSYLLIRKGAIEEKVFFSDVLNVRPSTFFSNPPRITLELKKAGKLGSEIPFYPMGTSVYDSVSKSDIFKKLVQQVATSSN